MGHYYEIKIKCQTKIDDIELKEKKNDNSISSALIKYAVCFYVD